MKHLCLKDLKQSKLNDKAESSDSTVSLEELRLKFKAGF